MHIEQSHSTTGSLRRIFTFVAVSALVTISGQAHAADTENVIAQLGDEPMEDAVTGVQFNELIFVDGGTSIDPEPDIGNKLIIATGQFSGPQVLGGNRTLLGGGATIRLRGLKSGTTRAYTAPGTQPTSASESGPGLRIEGDNVHVAGIRIRTAGDHNGVSGGSDRTNVAIQQMHIETDNSASRGIRFGENNATIRLMQNTVLTIDDGVRFGDNNRDVQITENTLTVSGGGQAVRLGDDNDGIKAAGNAIRADGDKSQGVRLGADNTNVVLSLNNFGTVGGDIFVFAATGNRLDSGSVGNSVAASPGGSVCDGSGSFEGALEVTDQNGNLLVFENGCAR